MTVGMVFTEGNGVDAMAVIAAGSGGGLDGPVLAPRPVEDRYPVAPSPPNTVSAHTCIHYCMKYVHVSWSPTDR